VSRIAGRLVSRHPTESTVKDRTTQSGFQNNIGSENSQLP
jgi:hypothetical protein